MWRDQILRSGTDRFLFSTGLRCLRGASPIRSHLFGLRSSHSQRRFLAAAAAYATLCCVAWMNDKDTLSLKEQESVPQFRTSKGTSSFNTCAASSNVGWGINIHFSIHKPLIKSLPCTQYCSRITSSDWLSTDIYIWTCDYRSKAFFNPILRKL